MRKLLFRYLAACWKHPGRPARRFIRSGLGLEDRARMLSTFWKEHLSRSRAAQARWARDSGGDVVTVLGAGPLLDLNAAVLSTKFRKFRLVDANPLLAQQWGRLNQPVEPVIVDITQCVAPWCEKVRRFRGTWEQTLEAIRDLGQTPVTAYFSASDGLISLNILSQLEVGWQEAVEPLLQKRFGKQFVLAHEQEWLKAIQPCSQALIEQHLAAIEASRARDVLLICDVEYVDYTGRLYQRNQPAEAPLQWTEEGWLVDEGIEYELIPALELTLNQESFMRWIPSYGLAWHESWLWHIAPNGTESTKYGKLHRVGAFALRLMERR